MLWMGVLLWTCTSFSAEFSACQLLHWNVAEMPKMPNFEFIWPGYDIAAVPTLLFDGSKLLRKFEIIATSGGNGGLQAAGSYLKAHIMDGAEKTAEYLAEANGNAKK